MAVENNATILCYSGGLDSTVLLYRLISLGRFVRCLSVDYGQRHGAQELNAARRIADTVPNAHFTALNLTAARKVMVGSSQTSEEIAVPEGHYTDESMKLTVVPNRNMILLAFAGAYAVSTKCYRVAYAAHAGDHAIYPDCRPLFVDAMQDALGTCNDPPVKLYTPFLQMTKADIVHMGRELNVPFVLTYSCYKGGRLHCGKCGTCVERKEAFQAAGVDDPTEYEVDLSKLIAEG